MKDINKMKVIIKEIDNIVKCNIINVEQYKISKIINELTPYDIYFNQNLMNKEEYDWSSDEFNYYFYYYKFKLFLLYILSDDNKKIDYYSCAMKIFTGIYNELKTISNVNDYDKICAITSLYVRLKSDFGHKENKAHVIGEYKLINMNDNKIKCYNLAYDFILKIIENLKENSFIFLSLLEVNSGFGKNINSDNEEEIFELSMLNLDMIKRHLKLLLPKLIFVIRHPLIISKRGSINKLTGNLFLYETSIFRNNINRSIDIILLYLSF